MSPKCLQEAYWTSCRTFWMELVPRKVPKPCRPRWSFGGLADIIPTKTDVIPISSNILGYLNFKYTVNSRKWSVILKVISKMSNLTFDAKKIPETSWELCRWGCNKGSTRLQGSCMSHVHCIPKGQSITWNMKHEMWLYLTLRFWMLHTWLWLHSLCLCHTADPTTKAGPESRASIVKARSRLGLHVQ